jgi:hypothetical protein
MEIHYLIESIQTPTRNCNPTSLWHTSQSWTLIPGGPTLCLYDILTSAWETFYQVCERLRRNGSLFLLQSCTRAVSDGGHSGLERSRSSNSSQRCSTGLWAGQSISGTLLSTNHSLTDLDLWQGALSCWYRQSSSPNWSSTVDSTQRVRMSLYPSVFRFPCSIARGPSPFNKKHPHTLMPPPPNFTVGTTYAGRYRSPGIRHTQTLPSNRHMV